jgi:Flp pilus assembly protein TadG
MVETALLMIPFFAILFAIIDYGQIYFYDNSLQNALRESARFATAGRIIPPLTGPLYETNQGVVVAKAMNDSEGREASRNECIRYWFQSNCVLNIPLTNITIFSAPSVGAEMPAVTTNNGVLHLVSGYQVTTNGLSVSTNSVAPVAGPGGAGDYVEITATYSIQTITPIPSWFGGYNGRAVSGGYGMRVSAIVKNEPALLNFEHTNLYPDEPNESPSTNQQ